MSEELSSEIRSISEEEWKTPKKILVILAHPDDPEFFCGGTIARWCALGHDVRYCLLTSGQRGWKDQGLSPEQVGRHRMEEQRKAAKVLGVGDIKYLDYMDGELSPTLDLRNDVIRQIRTQKPEIVVTSDPRTYFTSSNRMNHPDHRAAGTAVFDAIFPAAGNPRYQVLTDAGEELAEHQVEELWLTLTLLGDMAIDVTAYFDTRLEAILMHHSQIREPEQALRDRMIAKKVREENSGKMVYFEHFCRTRLV